MFFKIGVLQNFTVFIGKHLCWSIFLIKWHAFRLATLIKRDKTLRTFFARAITILKLLSFFCHCLNSANQGKSFLRKSRLSTEKIISPLMWLFSYEEHGFFHFVVKVLDDDLIIDCFIILVFYLLSACFFSFIFSLLTLCYPDQFKFDNYFHH